MNSFSVNPEGLRLENLEGYNQCESLQDRQRVCTVGPSRLAVQLTVRLSLLAATRKLTRLLQLCKLC